MWVAHRVVERKGKKQKLTTWHVGCTPHCRTKGKKTKINNTAYGLHAVLSNERENKTRRSELNEAAYGFHAASL